MLTRVDSFFDYFGLVGAERRRGERLADEAAVRSGGMTHLRDYEALAATALAYKPKHVFEIGTYLGVTSDFCLARSRILALTRTATDENKTDLNPMALSQSPAAGTCPGLVVCG